MREKRMHVCMGIVMEIDRYEDVVPMERWNLWGLLDWGRCMFAEAGVRRTLCIRFVPVYLAVIKNAQLLNSPLLLMIRLVESDLRYSIGKYPSCTLLHSPSLYKDT